MMLTVKRSESVSKSEITWRYLDLKISERVFIGPLLTLVM